MSMAPTPEAQPVLMTVPEENHPNQLTPPRKSGASDTEEVKGHNFSKPPKVPEKKHNFVSTPDLPNDGPLDLEEPKTPKSVKSDADPPLPEVFPPYLPRKDIMESAYTLVLDLDETLIHFVSA